jgi:Fic family protein
MNQRLQDLGTTRFESPAILKQLTAASRSLAELKGVIASIPQQGILINTLGIQEAKDSSAIENIVTTHDELYQQEALPETIQSAEAKEVHRYRQALHLATDLVRQTGLVTVNHITDIQRELLESETGIRTMPGTTLRNTRGEVVYTPPRDHDEILELLRNLESFINEPDLFDVDPLIKMALIHHQFESIHPFYDGNGRTGRILNVVYLVKEQLLDIPVLYLSRPLVQSKSDYYRLLQAVRDQDAWEEWVQYMLRAVRLSADDAIITINGIRDAMLAAKHQIRAQHKFYSQDLINHLFAHPYTKIDFMEQALNVSRPTATKYLDELTQSGILGKHRMGRSNYYVNRSLWAILASPRMQSP